MKLRGIVLGCMLTGFSGSPILAQERNPATRDLTPPPPAAAAVPAAPAPPPHWEQLRDRPLASNEIRQVFTSPAQPSGKGKDWGWWYTFVTPPAPTGYAIADFGYELTGNIGPRACHSWGECEIVSQDSSHIEIKWRTQGQEKTVWDYLNNLTFPGGGQQVLASIRVVVIYQKTTL